MIHDRWYDKLLGGVGLIVFYGYKLFWKLRG